jgi:hypothetical protein
LKKEQNFFENIKVQTNKGEKIYSQAYGYGKIMNKKGILQIKKVNHNLTEFQQVICKYKN